MKGTPKTARQPAQDPLVGFDATRMPGPLIRRCHQRSLDLYVEAVGREGPTRQQLATMTAIQQKPGASLAELSDATAIDRNTLAEMLGRLEKQGLVRRRRSERDARAWVLALTSDGEALLRDVLPRALAVQERILAPLPEELRPIFLRCLRLLAGLEKP